MCVCLRVCACAHALVCTSGRVVSRDKRWAGSTSLQRKENTSSEELVERRPERQQWVWLCWKIHEGKGGRSGEADPDLVKVSWPHLVTMQICDIMRPVAVASASHYKSTTPSSQSSSLLRVTTPWGIEITASIYYTFAATAVKCKHRSVWAEGHWQRRLHSRRRFGKMPRARLVHHPPCLFSSNLRCCWVSTQGLMGKHCNCVECFRYGQWCPSWL